MFNPKQEIKYTKIFIDNEFVNSVSGKTFTTVNPATEEVIAHIAEGDKADVDLAVKAAERAFTRGSEWRNYDASARGRLLYKLADLYERDYNILASLELIDSGKACSNIAMDMETAIKVLRYYAGYADKLHGKVIPSDGNFLTITRREPIGIAGLIVPWNFPLMLFTLKLAPAIAAGCTLVIKPAEQTPLTALYAAALCKEAGFPKGVINVIPGYGPTAGHAISSHPDIRKVSFTGSTEVGRIIMKTAADTNLKKVSLELGGKSPIVVMDDVDLDEAVLTAHIAVFANHGQCCCAGSRTYVQEGIYDEFVKRSIALTKYLKVGDPFDKTTQQGPQIDQEIYDRIMGYIEQGRKEGAKILIGGKRIGDRGFFIEPTIFSDVTDDMKIAVDEIFGPVQCILKFKTLDEVIERANKTNYGLAAGILSKNIDNALTFSQAVEAGTVWVNNFFGGMPQAPFGGYKESGHGREYNEEGVELYLETKTICIKTMTKS